MLLKKWTIALCQVQCSKTIHFLLFWFYRVFHVGITSQMNGCSSEMVQIWLHVGKIKMCMTGGNSFENCKQITEKCKQSFENWKNLPLLKHILALPTWGQIWMNTISAIYFWKIVYGTPCISHQYFREIHSLIFTFEYCPSEASSATQFWAISELKNSNFRNFNFFHDSLTYILCEF